MRFLLAIILMGVSNLAKSQHCPWDCTGLLLIKTNATKTEMNQLEPVLVDGKKMPVTDTIHGTGKPTYDVCNFLYYDDFIKYRTRKIKIHHWYAYDTLLFFAAGHYVVHYNYCRFKWDEADALFIRFNNPGDRSKGYRYMEIPKTKRIHLHDYNTEIRQRDTAKIQSSIQPFIIEVSRKEWGLVPR